MSSESIYLDYAATTPLREEVKQKMMEMLEGPFGNPSSTHQFGRKSRIIVEECRKFIASSFKCSTSEIIFTSGGTEADNTALSLAVRDLGVKRIISSPIEHHAVLHPSEFLRDKYNVQLDLVNLDEKGNPDLNHMEELLSDGQASLVSLMHANNEIGNILDLKTVGDLCRKYNAYFHSDTVQSIGQLEIDLSELPVDFITASAHKFYGPKGVGFLYMNSRIKVASFITGGAQERNMRGGTENILGLGAMHEALKWKLQKFDEENDHVKSIKMYMMDQLQKEFGNDVQFNGESGNLEKSLNKILSVSFPNLNNDMLLFNLDLKGIAASGGSACASGSLQGSHVIAAILPTATHPVVRFSFGKDSSTGHIDAVISSLKAVI